eukprot:CAMPEP_0170510214 /NCGR_PEP_ID=MMETSP0208-20121228/65647_1 /TAXON_ID=197538 /ORGANISM="Strombidium inclinatum, Strain S3" /LENGTH=118 /DNA_ID=CAMNT_0010793663 /DNA_START=183 /DNA_END=539 /DNA_ORIENTATION=+
MNASITHINLSRNRLGLRKTEGTPLEKASPTVEGEEEPDSKYFSLGIEHFAKALAETNRIKATVEGEEEPDSKYFSLGIEHFAKALAETNRIKEMDLSLNDIGPDNFRLLQCIFMSNT